MWHILPIEHSGPRTSNRRSGAGNDGTRIRRPTARVDAWAFGVLGYGNHDHLRATDMGGGPCFHVAFVPKQSRTLRRQSRQPHDGTSYALSARRPRSTWIVAPPVDFDSCLGSRQAPGCLYCHGTQRPKALSLLVSPDLKKGQDDKCATWYSHKRVVATGPGRHGGCSSGG